MSQTVKQLINTFDSLSAAEKHEATLEILRRYSGADKSDISDDNLVELAEELFCTLDNEEASDARR